MNTKRLSDIGLPGVDVVDVLLEEGNARIRKESPELAGDLRPHPVLDP